MTTTFDTRVDGLGGTADEHPRVATTAADDFSADHLLQLLKGDVYAVRITGLIEADALDGLRRVFVGRDDHGPLATDPQFRRIGHAFSETGPGQEAEYFDEAAGHRRSLRSLAAPYPYPSDSVRLLLDETWPFGATLLESESRKFFAGVVRYQQAGVDLEPHTDNVQRNLPDGGLGIRRQLSVNVYLDVPDVGGELEIWDSFPTEDDYRELSGGRAWGVDRSIVGEPAVTVKPTVGEAIFIDPRRVHAVAPSADRPRVTIGLFIGVRADEQPLAVWS
ncbi:2OG-Fe(II) oxygenase [Gordonia liuliyuniae]|uniref:2OG-Fe(II) oxygenase n=1 Tax=Gordonia liuliyuniae TaxID=2911517 RepID=A0ABS9INR9_9ACTN|nr:2OG-Fe(II) oxygenase [Gordonia liuliyuniae]MCF8587204.1 2OG-Fe(II) oxygenase [Gordonia liuliyuniae]